MRKRKSFKARISDRDYRGYKYALNSDFRNVFEKRSKKR